MPQDAVSQLLESELPDDEFSVFVATFPGPETRAALLARLREGRISCQDVGAVNRMFAVLGIADVGVGLLNLTLDAAAPPASRAAALLVLLYAGLLDDNPLLLSEALWIALLVVDEADSDVWAAALFAEYPDLFERMDRWRVLAGVSVDVYRLVEDDGFQERLATWRPPAARLTAWMAAPWMRSTELVFAAEAPAETLCVAHVNIGPDGLRWAYHELFVPRERALQKIEEDFSEFVPLPAGEAVHLLLAAARRGVEDDEGLAWQWASTWPELAVAPNDVVPGEMPTEQAVYEALDRYGLVWHYTEEEGLPYPHGDLLDPEVRRALARTLSTEAVRDTERAARAAAHYLALKGEAVEAAEFAALADDVAARGRDSYLVEVLLRWDGRTATPWEMAGMFVKSARRSAPTDSTPTQST